MRRPLLGLVLGIATLTLSLLHSSPVHAYAWMIKHGFAKCDSCHTDPSGGETLTLMGRAQAEHLLSLGGESAAGAGSHSRFLLGAVPEPSGVRLGGSYRHLFVHTPADGDVPSEFTQFPMQLDVYGSGHLGMLVFGGSFGVARGINGTAHVRGAQLNRELGDGWIALSRTHFVGARLDDYTLLRVGRLNLPFGVRVPEHVLWAREATRTDRESDQQHGVAIAHARGPLRFEGMAIIGNFQLYPDRYRERGYSASLEYLIGDTSAVGLSSLLMRANEDRFTQVRQAVRQAHGANGRFGLSRRLAVLAEADLLEEGGRELGYVGLLQADYEPLRGLHFTLTGEAHDQGPLQGGSPRSPGNGEPRFGAWVSLLGYVASHLELRLDFVKRQNSPLTTQVQLHVWL